MNGVIIVISVDTPIHKKTQLLQHFLITQVNKIDKIIICLNKIDLVDKHIVQSRKEELDELLLKYNIKPFIIIPTSFNKMIGINNVINSIMTLFNPNDLSNKYNDKPLFRISRSFDINKPGTDWNNVVGGILGGTLIKGTLKINDEIEIRPGLISNNKWNPIKTKIISIKSDNINLDNIISGGLVGIGTLIDSYYCKNDLLIGNIIGLVDNLPNVYTNIDILINIVDTNNIINKNDNLILYIGTNSFNGNIININNNILNLKLNKPICIDNNDNIIICNKLNKIIGYGSLYIK
jgi:translation initiation factor 2 subunit 3